MPWWRVVAHEDFPIWVISRRLLERKRLDDGRIQWLLEADEYVTLLPRSVRGIQSVEPAVVDETVSRS